MIDSARLGQLPFRKGVRPLFFLAFWMMLSSGCEKSDIPEPESDLIQITDYDGNTYYAKQIGDQWWMVNNLRSTHYSNGERIRKVESYFGWSTLQAGDRAYCYYNNNQGDEARIYGALYTWAAAVGGAIGSDENPSGIQGVCPEGWHLPSDEEWKELEIHLGMPHTEKDSEGIRGANVGSSLASSPHLWQDGYLKTNAAFGLSGFIAIPGGGRRYNGSFGHLGDNANFWTASQKDIEKAWGRHIYSDYSSIHRYSNVKSDGFSVRCVKDE